MAVAKEWNNVYANAVNPGWVPTKMGGTGAPDSLEEGYQTHVWLAVSNDPEAKVSGSYFHIMQQARFLPAAKETPVQKKFLTRYRELTDVRF
jgi:NAD(P)-dependent dehydrogenase (short-subunit alcohol dehydrogenase family)